MVPPICSCMQQMCLRTRLLAPWGWKRQILFSLTKQLAASYIPLDRLQLFSSAQVICVARSCGGSDVIVLVHITHHTVESVLKGYNEYPACISEIEWLALTKSVMKSTWMVVNLNVSCAVGTTTFDQSAARYPARACCLMLAQVRLKFGSAVLLSHQERVLANRWQSQARQGQFNTDELHF